MNTTIYLDVDGVLNAIGPFRKREDATGWNEWRTVKVNGWQIQYAPELIGNLNRIAGLPAVTIKWLTTWEHDAASDLSPAIGLNGQEWPVLESGKADKWSRRDWWKLNAIRDDITATNPDRFIWIDDDLSLEGEALAWVDSFEPGRVLAISPFQSRGITQEEISLIEAHIGAEVTA